MKLTCAIIDDEPLAVELLESYVRKTPFLELKGAYNGGITALEALKTEPVDLLFCDIQMPELSGLEFARIISKETKIVFTTAFDQYAIDGYNVNALDYLLKPISFERFLQTVNKALEWFDIQDRQKTMREDRFVFVKSEYKLQKINFDDILYVEGVKDYVKFYFTDSSKNIMSLMNMKKVEEYLPSPEFMRIHRSYIVHMPKVELIDRFRIVIGDQYLPISESYKNEMLKYIDSHSLV